MRLRHIRHARIRPGTRVLVRVDFNVVIKEGRVLDDFRMREALLTLSYLIKRKCRIRIVGHLGRPGGRRVARLSLLPLAKHLAGLLDRRIQFIRDPFDQRAIDRYDGSRDILFFENLRFWPGEEKNNESFARALATWGDLYVNEAFSDIHRAHASMVALPKYIPGYAGFRLFDEVRFLGKARDIPARPCLVIFGGAKVSTKLPLIRKFLKVADRIIIAGAMANTVFLREGIEIGVSTAERDMDGVPPRAFFRNQKLLYPVDVVVMRGGVFARGRTRRVRIGALRSDDFIVDSGPRSIELFVKEAKRAKTVIWNGPLGYTDILRFQRGTRRFAEALSRMRSFRVVGGGETVAVLNRAKLVKKFSHVSTGGGAMLEFFMGKRFPALDALSLK